MQNSVETDLATLLSDLLAVQGEMLHVFAAKRDLLAAGNAEALAAVAPQEEKLVHALEDCLRRRQQLLARAAQEGLPTRSIRHLTEALPKTRRDKLQQQVREAGSRARLLQHQSLTNWVLIQRTLIHLSQLLEIIATGGRLQPTYEKGEPTRRSGSLADWAA